MFNMNTIAISGFMGSDPETHQGQSTTVAKFRLGVSQRTSGNKEAATMWLTVKCFGKQADFAAANLHKGDAVAVQGRLTEESWTDRNQQTRTAFVVNADLVHQDRATHQQQQQAAAPQHQPDPAAQQQRRGNYWNGAPQVPAVAPPAVDESIDEVPF